MDDKKDDKNITDEELKDLAVDYARALSYQCLTDEDSLLNDEDFKKTVRLTRAVTAKKLLGNLQNDDMKGSAALSDVMVKTNNVCERLDSNKGGHTGKVTIGWKE